MARCVHDPLYPLVSSLSACNRARMNRVLMWAGALVLATGLITGFSPLSSHGVNCGSAYAPKDEHFYGDDHAADCTGLRSVMRVPALVLSISGIALLAAGWIRHSSESAPEGEGYRTILGRPVGRRDDEGPAA